MYNPVSFINQWKQVFSWKQITKKIKNYLDAGSIRLQRLLNKKVFKNCFRVLLLIPICFYSIPSLQFAWTDITFFIALRHGLSTKLSLLLIFSPFSVLLCTPFFWKQQWKHFWLSVFLSSVFSLSVRVFIKCFLCNRKIICIAFAREKAIIMLLSFVVDARIVLIFNSHYGN